MDFVNYTRRKTSTTRVGSVLIGGSQPIRIQTMANTSTNDIEGSVAQALRCYAAGAELLRFTTQGLREVESLGQIHRLLQSQLDDRLPLVADVHFQAGVADEAAKVVEKVRINPGNYIDPARKFKHIDYTEEEYAAELQRLRERFTAFLAICREHHTAVRLGVNHGSLSDRIMSRYGDTPAGMVESVMEFLRVARDEQFTDIVISIKASNTRVMVDTMRLLVAQMDKEEMAFPLHLGVTEAGGLRAGTVKSALGIGSLLMQGIGDTLRVSLTADVTEEIKVGFEILRTLGLRYHGVRIVSCPTCARRGIDVESVVKALEVRLEHISDPLKIAVMGCVVNGPGEAHGADIGVCGGGNGKALLFVKGVQKEPINAENVVETIAALAEQMMGSKQ